MAKSKKNLLSYGIVLLSMAAVLLIAFSNSELQNAWGALGQMHPGWLGVCLLLAIGYMVFCGLGLYVGLRLEGYEIRVSTAIHMAMIGLFYANVTPGSSGGQPMQVYRLRERGVPGAVTTSVLTVQFFTMQLSLMLLVLALWLPNRAFVAQQLGGLTIAAVLGAVINFSAVPLVLLAAFHIPLITRWAHRLIGWLGRKKLVKHPENAQTRADDVLATYHHAIRRAFRHGGTLLLQILCSLGAMLCLLGVPAAVYHAFSQSGTHDLRLLLLSALLFVSASYTPLPGASGAQEGGFMLYFRGVFAGGLTSVALLVWRFFTFYLFLLLGFGDSLWGILRSKRTPISHAPARKE